MTVQNNYIPASPFCTVVSKSTELPQGSISESEPLSDAREKPRVELPGLTWVRCAATNILMAMW